MTNEEMNRIMAEKVYGWHWEDIRGMKGFRAWLDSSNTMQYWAEMWDPAENIAQADAVMLALCQAQALTLTERTYWQWEGESPRRTWFFDVLLVKDYHHIASSDGPVAQKARIICEAIVKAVSDD